MLLAIRVVVEELPQNWNHFLSLCSGIGGVILGAYLSKINQREGLKKEKIIRYREEKFDVYSKYIVEGYFKDFNEKNHVERDAITIAYLNQLRIDFRFLPQDIQKDFIKYCSGEPRYFKHGPRSAGSPFPNGKREEIREWCQKTFDTIQKEYDQMLKELEQ